MILINEDFLEKEKELKVIGPKYLGQSFWGAIDWREMSPSTDLVAKESSLMTCPFEIKITFKMVLSSYRNFLLTVLVVSLGFLKCLLLFKYGS